MPINWLLRLIDNKGEIILFVFFGVDVKKRIGKMFETFPRENVPVTGGKAKYKQKKTPRK